MAEPLSTIIGAKILDQLLGKAVGKAMDTALGGASRALKDARAELDKETAQRAARMTLIVQPETRCCRSCSSGCSCCAPPNQPGPAQF